MTIVGLCCPIGPRWYLVRTERYREALAAEAVHALGIETFMPAETLSVRHARRTSIVTRPLFRQYLFTRFDLARSPWREIDKVRYVDHLEKRDEIPLRIPDKQIDALRRAQDCGLFDHTKEAFPQGCKVRIIDGPFADFCAEVVRASAKERVELLLGHLGRIHIDRLHLEKLC